MKVLAPDQLPEKGIRFSRPHLWRLVKEKQFPPPIKLGANRIAWVETEIDAWLRAKVAERDSSGETT